LLNSNYGIKFEQELTDLNLKYYHITNKLIIQTIRNSIFTNLTVIIHCSIILLYCNSLLIFKQLQNITSLFLLSFKLNNKIYYKKQLENLKTVSYAENVIILYNFIKHFTQLFYYRLKKTKAISK